MHKPTIAALVSLLLFAPALSAGELAEIRNYREYSPIFASAGQPDREQFERLRQEGFERVVYIAFATSKGAIADEDQLVRDLGMDYAQVPVVWDAPTRADFETFAAIMRSAPDKKTLLHCQANYRASAFAFLYRVLYEGVPIEEARADMNSVWEPEGAWAELIEQVLADRGSAAN